MRFVKFNTARGESGDGGKLRGTLRGGEEGGGAAYFVYSNLAKRKAPPPLPVR